MTGRELEKMTHLILQWCEVRKAFDAKAPTAVQIVMMAAFENRLNDLAEEAQYTVDMMQNPFFDPPTLSDREPEDN